jgi:tetratricopeptide (TPR) repeat protein
MSEILSVGKQSVVSGARPLRGENARSRAWRMLSDGCQHLLFGRRRLRGGAHAARTEAVFLRRDTPEGGDAGYHSLAVNAMRAVVSCGSGLCVILATSMPVFASTVSDCQWATNDPRSIVEACTTLLHSANVVEPWMHFNRGLAFRTLGRLEEAYSDYSKAIDLNPSFAAAYTNRGTVRVLRNDLVGALRDFRKALRLDPSDEVARDNSKAIRAALREVGAD